MRGIEETERLLEPDGDRPERAEIDMEAVSSTGEFGGSERTGENDFAWFETLVILRNPPGEPGNAIRGVVEHRRRQTGPLDQIGRAHV